VEFFLKLTQTYLDDEYLPSGSLRLSKKTRKVPKKSNSATPNNANSEDENDLTKEGLSMCYNSTCLICINSITMLKI
jgi:hypothetical protein